MADPFTTYKLIVLYMAKHATQALTNSQISEFILDREYTDYFQLQKVLSELTETELLHKRTITNSSYYELKDARRFPTSKKISHRISRMKSRNIWKVVAAKYRSGS